MLSVEQNELVTRIGPGTPCGELMRRYWQPLCPVADLTPKRPKKRVRILGEDLVVYRDQQGRYACIDEHCAHRRASLYYGFVEPDGIRCFYHGWKFSVNGECLDRPFERAEGNKSIKLRAYPVRALGGLLFVYMGPEPAKAPLLPRWDVLVRDDRPRKIRVLPVHNCNWLQIQENAADTLHTYYLHGHLSRVYGFDTTYLGDYYYRPIQHYDWAPCEWGVAKTVVYGGDNPEEEIRPPMIFPNVLRVPAGPVETMQWRVPIDDTHTRIFWVGLMPLTGPQATPMSEHETVTYLPEEFDENGDHNLESFYSQDRAALETQGEIVDRSLERLGASDKGIVLFRKMLIEQIERVRAGQEPEIAVVRDPEQNRMIEFPGVTAPWVTV
ncbi:MAG: Rieske 2Fe-2S domain-containing protein [Burkholderiaceae bacterium]